MGEEKVGFWNLGKERGGGRMEEIISGIWKWEMKEVGKWRYLGVCEINVIFVDIEMCCLLEVYKKMMCMV